MADRSPDRSWYRLRWSRPAPDLRAVRLECKRCAMLRYSSSNPRQLSPLGTLSVSKYRGHPRSTFPVALAHRCPRPHPQAAGVKSPTPHRTQAAAGCRRGEDSPRRREAATQERRKVQHHGAGRGPQAAAQAPVRGVRQPGERAGRRGRRRSRRPAASAAARVDAAARRTRRPTAAAREPHRLEPLRRGAGVVAASRRTRRTREAARVRRPAQGCRQGERGQGKGAGERERNARVQAEVQVGAQARSEPADALAGVSGRDRRRT